MLSSSGLCQAWADTFLLSLLTCAGLHTFYAGLHTTCAGLHTTCAGMHTTCADLPTTCAGLHPLCWSSPPVEDVFSLWTY